MIALAAIALAAAGFLLRDDVFIYGDHPGHYWMMWYTIHVAVPLHHRLIDWNPYWYAGYPELQFYPPGFALFGWLLRTLALGYVPTPLVYEIVVWIAYALPAFTFYYALRHLGFERRVAFLAGLFGLVFPAFFDGTTAVFIGMLGSRFAFALNALVLVWAIDCIEQRGARYAWLTAFALAAEILAHPYHLLGVLFALGVYTLCVARRVPLRRASARLAAVLLGAVALDAFWLAPLIAHASTQMIPLIRSTFDQTWRILTDAIGLPYAALALFAIRRVRRERTDARRALIVALIAMLFGIGAAMLVAHALLIERWQFYQLDPVRLIGEFYFPLLWLAALGAAEIADLFSRRLQRAWRFTPHALTALTALALVALTLFFLVPSLQSAAFYQPRPNDEPRFLSQAQSDYRLDELWETLRATEGRVWFTSYKTHLTARNTEPFPTTIMALTPLFANRQIMGGTFSAWSPVAAWMWTRHLRPPVLRGLVEEQDDRALFGVPLEKLSDAQLFEYCTRFNITTIVASVNDFHTRAFLDASPRFQSYYNNGFFYVYRVVGPESAWATGTNASVEVTRFEDQQINLRVRSASEGARATIKVYAYPLWRVQTSAGESLNITHDDFGLMQIALPRGDDYTVEVRYELGAPENLGNAISMVSAAGLGIAGLGIAARRFRKK